MSQILLTGASRGIGRAIAEELIHEGHQVWGTARHVDSLKDIKGLHPIELDLISAEQVNRLLPSVLAEIGHLDCLINNAGSGTFGPLLTTTSREEADLFQLILFTPRQLIAQAMPLMIQQGSGLIINFSSLAVRFPIPLMGTYNAAKAALTAYTRTLQIEYANSGVRFVDVQPGDICTDFHHAMKRTDAVGYDSQKIEAVWKAIDDHMRLAPPVTMISKRVAKWIRNPSAAPTHATIGDFFQAKIAPLAYRFLPVSFIDRIQCKYYGL